MDRSGQQRELVFCHQCENEWYNDEHGLTCPACHSDVVEIIDPDHDPREDDLHAEHDDDDEEMDEAHHHRHHLFETHNPWADAPDPDEGELDEEPFGWRQTGPGRMSFHGTFYHNAGPGAQNRQGQPAAPNANADNPLLQNFAAILQGIAAGAVRNNNQAQASGRDGGSQTHAQGRGPQVRVTHNAGPGFAFSATTTRLQPREANQAQPHNHPVDDLPNMLGQVFGPFINDNDDAGGGMMNPMAHLIQTMLNPTHAVHGNYVYTQEALDRVISQLADQTAASNAAPPAPADAIANLPKVPLRQAMLGKDAIKEGKTQGDCSICMDEVALGETVTELPCKHWFHGLCIESWLNEHNTCPCCREPITPKDGPKASGSTARRSSHGAEQRRDSSGLNMSGAGTLENPWTLPDSPNRERRSSGNSRRRSNSSGGGGGADGGIAGRVRNLFGGGARQ
ncbi:hypothetical protein BJ546DRAFT_849410 [Cryomyces antarcticus]|nr:hypothetical protein LTR60_004541 [Cryomyces antarcticus]